MNNETAPFGFFLSAEMLCEILKDQGVSSELLTNCSDAALTGVQYYLGQEKPLQQCVYLCTDRMLREKPFCAEGCVLVVIGETHQDTLPLGCAVIAVPEGEDINALLNRISEVFVTYSLLEKELNEILNRQGSLVDVCRVALRHFGNPVFVHDEYYNILACPQLVEGLSFTFNEHTQRYMQSIDTLNAFKTSRSYRETLTTHGGQIWESDFSKSSPLYANIWMGSEYKGRFVVSEAFGPIKPFQLQEATFFSEIIKSVMMRRHIEDGDENPLKPFIVDAINGLKPDQILLGSCLSAQHWEMDDRYMVGVLSLMSEAVTHMSVFAMCNDLETHIPGGWTCYYKNAIYLIVNLTQGGIAPGDLRMRMAYTIRESMMNMGVSNPFRDFTEFPMYLKQAQVALEYGRKKEAPTWYNEFRDCVLEYWLREGKGDFSEQALASGALIILRKYDEKHNSDLYLTLKTYLHYERNSSLTSRVLKLHRSTLPYRLDKVAQLTSLNLNDFNTRLYLNMSFKLMDGD